MPRTIQNSFIYELLHQTLNFQFRRAFALDIKRPFAVRYNPYNQSIEILSNAQQVADVVSDLKGDICIIFDALKKLEQTSEPNAVQKKRLLMKYQRLEEAFRNLSIDSFN
jgi:hypothetical protein